MCKECIWMIICPIPEALFDFWRYSLKGYQPSCDMLCFMTSSLLLFSSRQKNDTRNPWKSWTSWPLSIWRTWSRCSSSGSSLKTNASVFSKSSCWRWNSTWISQPITGEIQDNIEQDILSPGEAWDFRYDPENNVQYCLHRFQTIYHTLEDTISATDAEEDLKWFRTNQGPGMPMNWPQFEVLHPWFIPIRKQKLKSWMTGGAVIGGQPGASQWGPVKFSCHRQTETITEAIMN